MGGGESGCSNCRCSGNGCGGCLQGAVIAGWSKGFGVADVVRWRLRFGLLGLGFRHGIGLGVWIGIRSNLRRDAPLTCGACIFLPDNAAQVQLHVFHERIVVQTQQRDRVLAQHAVRTAAFHQVVRVAYQRVCHLRVDGLAVQLRSAHAALLRVVYADERAARAQNGRVDVGADDELKPLRNLEEVAARLGQAAC